MVTTRATSSYTQASNKTSLGADQTAPKASRRSIEHLPDLKRPSRHQKRQPTKLSDQEAGVRTPGGELDTEPPPRSRKKRRGKGFALLLATWNTMGWSNRIHKHIESSKQDVIALTECGAKVLKSAGPGLIVTELPAAGDPAGTAAIHLSPRAQRMVLNSGHKGSRLAWVRLRGQFANILIISAYIPHKYRKQAPFQEDTLAELEVLIAEKSVKGDCVVVMGDMNAKLARGMAGLTGKYCMHSEADNGGESLRLTKIMSIMQSRYLSAASTYFCPRDFGIDFIS